MQHDDATPGSDQAASTLPAVPIPPQQRQQLLSQLPADLAATFQAAADTLHSTADALVSLRECWLVHASLCGSCLRVKTIAALVYELFCTLQMLC